MSKTNGIPIWPSYMYNVFGDCKEVATFVRKRGTDNLWYKRLIFIKSTGLHAERDLVDWLIEEVYKFQILGTMPVYMCTIDGFPIIELDSDQTDEKERLST